MSSGVSYDLADSCTVKASALQDDAYGDVTAYLSALFAEALDGGALESTEVPVSGEAMSTAAEDFRDFQDDCASYASRYGGFRLTDAELERCDLDTGNGTVDCEFSYECMRQGLEPTDLPTPFSGLRRDDGGLPGRDMAADGLPGLQYLLRKEGENHAYYCVKWPEVARTARSALPDPAGRSPAGGWPAAQSGVSFQNILRLNDPDYDRNTDYYERGKQIVPDLVAPCENEIPIRQYHVVDIRSRLQGLWAEGRIMVTNKRLLFRASGRSFIGRTRVEQEYELDEISGINISHGVRFSLFDFFNSFLLAALCGTLVYLLLGQEPGMAPGRCC